jgi:hypothetical protein
MTREIMKIAVRVLWVLLLLLAGYWVGEHSLRYLY